MANSAFAQRLCAVRQALFPSFERKTYHLQFRHGALVTMMLMCASFVLPAFHQTPPFPLSDFTSSQQVPTEPSYNQIHRYVKGIIYYNVAIAFFIAIHFAAEPWFHRGAPVWYELTWMSLAIVGEVVCLGLMASFHPEVCNFHFGVDTTVASHGKYSAKNSATSICSNWRGMNGLLAAIIGVFLLHVTWHLVVSIRHINRRQGVFTLPITDYRWNLPKPLERIRITFPTDVEGGASERKESKDMDSTQFTSADYTKSAHSDTIAFPTTSDDYSNYSRPTASQGTTAKLHALPVSAKPVVLEQSIVTRSDTPSIVESD